jgi:hypothetical protein
MQFREPDDVEAPALGVVDLGEGFGESLGLGLSSGAGKFVKDAELERHAQAPPARYSAKPQDGLSADVSAEHDPEKWVPVSRLREALARFPVLLDASAGEGRSEKVMLK